MKQRCKLPYMCAMMIFFIIFSLEQGIWVEILWHGWGGFGDPSKEYTATGEIGISILLSALPAIVLIGLTLYIVKWVKKRISFQELFLGCIFAVLGIFFSWIYVHFFSDDSLLFQLGRNIASFLIETFQWMRWPIP